MLSVCCLTLTFIWNLMNTRKIEGIVWLRKILKNPAWKWHFELLHPMMHWRVKRNSFQSVDVVNTCPQTKIGQHRFSEYFSAPSDAAYWSIKRILCAIPFEAQGSNFGSTQPFDYEKLFCFWGIWHGTEALLLCLVAYWAKFLNLISPTCWLESSCPCELVFGSTWNRNFVT